MLMQNYMEHVAQALQVDKLGATSLFSKETGINSLPLILLLQTLEVPHSFPLNMMYLIY